ncbi:hypothetical protein JOC34_000539 [Virgibacillus halotolerans]|uniref:hypothetical protein n=1 Tax=Virgibacillus halotolerans TaxID=1071053 RepID=UPI0019617664|nr:hypothetical protein [Virgibacillus halotolerans]MBM7598182.1 hypothetical protein [Virgibacillus halotolerans]
MTDEKQFIDDTGSKFKYALAYLYYGWDEAEYSNDLDELDEIAKEMIADNSGKPLIIVNANDEIVREYTERKR